MYHDRILVMYKYKMKYIHTHKFLLTMPNHTLPSRGVHRYRAGHSSTNPLVAVPRQTDHSVPPGAVSEVDSESQIAPVHGRIQR